MSEQERYQRYWRRNIRLVLSLLAIWVIPSFGFGILGVDLLDRFQVGGFPLGFWFAQQGSIYIFVVLILIYALRMDKLDRESRDGKDDAQ